MSQSLKALYLSHGGGPMPLLGDPGHQEMVDCLTALSKEISKPSAIIVVSAHWEANVPTITSGPKPDLIYDYYGFPPESYDIQYPCPGEPKLAEHLYDLFKEAGVPAKLDDKRGYDHGHFIPLKILFPEADIPCIQLSLLHSLDASSHIQIGRILGKLDWDNLLLIGSGFSFHNMQAFFGLGTPQQAELNHAFENWLLETCNSNELTENEREQRLVEWEKAPGARFCHPREEHLLPLHVCYGAMEKPSKQSFELTILGKRASMYLW